LNFVHHGIVRAVHCGKASLRVETALDLHRPAAQVAVTVKENVAEAESRELLRAGSREECVRRGDDPRVHGRNHRPVPVRER
jgi:hypothetical protein